MGIFLTKILNKRTSDGHRQQSEDFANTLYISKEMEGDSASATPKSTSLQDLRKPSVRYSVGSSPNDTTQLSHPESDNTTVRPALETLVSQEDTVNDGDDPPAGSTVASLCHLWDRDNPDQQGLVLQSDEYKFLLQDQRAVLVQSVEVKPMLPILRQLDVINADRQERIELRATRGDMVSRMVSVVEKGPLWHLHGFLRGLAVTNQDYLIGVLGLDPNIYLDPPIEPPVPDSPTPSTAVETLNLTDDDNADESQQEKIPMGPLPVFSDGDAMPDGQTRKKRRKRGLLLCCGRSKSTSV